MSEQLKSNFVDNLPNLADPFLRHSLNRSQSQHSGTGGFSPSQQQRKKNELENDVELNKECTVDEEEQEHARHRSTTTSLSNSEYMQQPNRPDNFDFAWERR